ncbi:aldo/keto reductase [Phaeacidiphilus oryzae]|uniref:aldo/keto reductase n=1 Tax=Phaeacidiphilus oryzae TaxID=348818 RepID=UPI00056CAD0F|nr:aldo/keto reductase [Phaeacidiphilus oryzae]
MSTVPAIKLNNGVAMPQLGFGVYLVPPDEAQTAVESAFEAGYRHIDTAALYQNEEGVGRAIAASGIPREEVFVTTKLWNDDQGYESTLRAFDTSMAKLGLDVLDLYLIHWPLADREDFLPTWRAFEKLYAEGRIRAIGVSNFQPRHLRRLGEEFEVVPAVNQIELHPFLQQSELRAFDREHGIATEAWSPLGRTNGALADEDIRQLAGKYDKSPAQIVLRWHMQLGNIAIPKSVTPSRIRENIDVFDFELTQTDMDLISTLDRGERVGPDPDVLDGR